MSAEKRQDLVFHVAYSFCYEKMMYKFWGRLDKLCSLLLLVFSATIVSALPGQWVLGFFTAGISVVQLIYSPGAKCVQSKASFCGYSRLYFELPKLDDEQIQSRLTESQTHDSDAIGLLAHPAYLAACAMTGREPPNHSPSRAMSFWERTAAHFVGEFPEYRGG